MSKQTFTAFEREAIWTAYNRKCAYTGRVLEIDNFHIEHIIPEAMTNNKDELSKILKSFNLPQDFNIFGYENLLPCHPSANLTKSNKTLISTTFFINFAIEKKTTIEDNISRLQAMSSRGKFIMSLRQASEKNMISIGKMQELIALFDDKPDDAFSILVELEFQNKVVFNKISKNEVDNLLSTPLDAIDKLYRRNNCAEEEYIIKNCNDYFKALSDGFYPYSTYDMCRVTHLEQKCGLLKALQFAKLPLKSFIEKPRKSITDIGLIPFKLFPYVGENSSKPTCDVSYGHMIKEGVLKIVETSSHSIRVEDDGMGQVLIEAMRADFDGDGIEDILLFESCYATGGTLRFGGVRIISIKEEGGNFVQVNIANED